MATLPYKQSLKFYIFYRKLYGVNEGLPHIKACEEDKHIKKRHRALKKILKDDYDIPYTHRGGRTETYGEYVFSWLRLAYGPIVDDD